MQPKTTLLTIAVSLTIAASVTSYRLSQLRHPTDGQKKLMTVLNTIVGAGTTTIFGLLK
jgi:hypothetical protein